MPLRLTSPARPVTGTSPGDGRGAAWSGVERRGAACSICSQTELTRMQQKEKLENPNSGFCGPEKFREPPEVTTSNFAADVSAVVFFLHAASSRGERDGRLPGAFKRVSLQRMMYLELHYVSRNKTPAEGRAFSSPSDDTEVVSNRR
ncbi:hypothetical protein EYF80_037059 [Liparis tanakae]|uniref:Uncharacterized protein n=1 Tax=Liparis tanakae TaxID=230148 RepID=A0A4Z2GHV5_9TELE|nr:hypothetical protein EYF80_037059 [Liparis tanakae]